MGKSPRKCSEIWGEDFSTCQEGARNSGRISGQTSENISEISAQIARRFSETLFSKMAMLSSSTVIFEILTFLIQKYFKMATVMVILEN